MTGPKQDPTRGFRGQREPNAPPQTVLRPELLVNGSDREFRRFVHGLLAFAARMHTVRGGFARVIGLSGTQYTILISISHLERDAPVSVGMVADHLHLSGAFITVETGRLLKLGLLRKEQDLKDRRRVCLSVTPKGHDLLAALASIQARVNDVMFEFLDASQFRQVLGMLEQILSCGDRAISLLRYLAHEQLAADQGYPSALLKDQERQPLKLALESVGK